MILTRVILRDYVRVGGKHTQQINVADFLSVALVDGWVHVQCAAGLTLVSPSSVIQVDFAPEPQAEVPTPEPVMPVEVKRGKTKTKN